MHTEDCPPSGHLMSSMRAVGYSLSTAIADLIDNSIAAKAHTVNVLFDGSSDSPYVAIIDDGLGMDAGAARSAMQLAGPTVSDERDEFDLGRFGLGLKTASLSQCRRLTLVTKKAGNVTALTWDLDVMEASGKWSLLVHHASE